MCLLVSGFAMSILWIMLAASECRGLPAVLCCAVLCCAAPSFDTLLIARSHIVRKSDGWQGL
jgi:hypothetical protein